MYPAGRLLQEGTVVPSLFVRAWVGFPFPIQLSVRVPVPVRWGHRRAGTLRTVVVEIVQPPTGAVFKIAGVRPVTDGPGLQDCEEVILC